MSSADEYAQRLAPLLPQAGAYARSVLRKRADAEDAVQDAAMKALQHYGRYDASRSFNGWWFAILRNVCIDRLRRSRVHRTVGIDEVDCANERTQDDAEWQALADAMARLSPPHEEILRLRYFGGLSYAELAEALAIPAGTVMSRLHLALAALAASMEITHETDR